MDLFLQTAPPGFDVIEFRSAVCSLEQVVGIGDLHVWSLTPSEHHLTCRVAIDTAGSDRGQAITAEVERLCQAQFGIGHATI